MAYLNSPRLTFSGRFQADPSTVNNDVEHYNNATFIPSYQEYGAHGTNGWWNPDGTGNWRLIDCVITSVTYKDGTSTSDPAKDPVIGISIMDSNSRVAGKIVDLDPQQQSVSQVWGMIVRICTAENNFVKGDFAPIAFSDIWWMRSFTERGSGGACAVYQSAINNLEWSENTLKSRYLDELKAESPDQLSMKFNVDMFDQTKDSAKFSIGRIVGSIGPSKVEEPSHFVLGRQFIPDLSLTSGMYLPSNSLKLYMATAIIDETTKQAVLDLGNFLPTTGKQGDIQATADLFLAAVTGPQQYQELGSIDYKKSNWYESEGGLVTVSLTDDQVQTANQYPLTIATKQSGVLQPVVNESALYLRADQFVFRLNPGESATVDFYASNLGQPLAGQSVNCELSTSLINIMGQGNGTPVTASPDILSFNASSTTDASGKAELVINAGDPNNPRDFIDGQVYALWYYLEGQQSTDFTFNVVNDQPVITPATLSGVDPNNFISILAFDQLPEQSINNPDWTNDMLPVMQQYANLYPLMSKGIFNLAQQEVVDNNAQLLSFVFGLPIEDPNHMPVTRDLSRDKRKMILNYLGAVLEKQRLETGLINDNHNP